MDPHSFRSPRPQTRPKFRWSWPGVAVEPDELAAEIAEMAAAGFGGAEITTLEFGLPPDARSPLLCAWGTDRWSERIGVALRAGEEASVEIDMTIGPSWPWASPAVSGDDIEMSQHELLRGELPLGSGTTFTASVPKPEGLDAQHAHLVAVTAARIAGDPDLEPVVLDPESAIDLTKMVDDAGCLRWDVPDGNWRLFGFWHQPTLQRARSAIPNVCEPPFVVDHLRRASVEAALRYLDEHLLDRIGPERANLAELVEYSLELVSDGPYWTPGFLDEFRARRGYDPVRLLPALRREDPSAETPGRVSVRYAFAGDVGERFQRDYHQTLTDLWVDGHLRPVRKWANARGIRSRVQIYGGPFDNIALAMAVDIPETEDLYSNTLDFWRTIASGAHLAGAEKVSMELGAVINADYMMTLRELKRRSDKAFTAGVNQMVMHVYPYKFAEGMRWPTYAPWSSPYLMEGTLGFSDAWNNTNPQWVHLRALADYLGRAQTLLRTGRPVADVAVYRDLYGYPTDYGDVGTRVPLGLDPPEPALNASLHEAGVVFDFINPATLVSPAATVRDRRLIVQEPGYGALVVELEASRRGAVDHSHAMPGMTAQRLATMAAEGLPMVFVGGFPERGVSLRDAAAEDAEVRTAIDALRAAPNVRLVADGSEVPAALTQLGLEQTLRFDAPHQLYVQCRRGQAGDYWFIWNAAESTAELTGSFAARDGTTPQEWDLWSGASRPIGLYRRVGDRVEVPLRIAPNETLAIGFGAAVGPHVTETTADEAVSDGTALFLRSTRGGRVVATRGDGSELELDLGPLPAAIALTTWELHVDAAGPEGIEVHDLTLANLADWRTIPALRHSSGMGTYRTRFVLGDQWTDPGLGAYLELGTVFGGVQVRLNGSVASPACVAPERIDVGQFLRSGENVLEVDLTTTLKNRVDSLVDNPAYSYLIERPERTQPYGLLGPVALVPYAQGRVV
jgi:hypothetical protein